MLDTVWRPPFALGGILVHDVWIAGGAAGREMAGEGVKNPFGAVATVYEGVAGGEDGALRYRAMCKCAN